MLSLSVNSRVLYEGFRVGHWAQSSRTDTGQQLQRHRWVISRLAEYDLSAAKPTPAKLLKSVIVSGSLARREQVKHLDARAGRLDTAGDRPRGHRQPARRAPRPARCPAPRYPAPSPATVLRRRGRRVNASPDSVRVHDVVLGFCSGPARPGSGDHESVWHGQQRVPRCARLRIITLRPARALQLRWPARPREEWDFLPLKMVMQSSLHAARSTAVKGEEQGAGDETKRSHGCYFGWP